MALENRAVREPPPSPHIEPSPPGSNLLGRIRGFIDRKISSTKEAVPRITPSPKSYGELRVVVFDEEAGMARELYKPGLQFLTAMLRAAGMWQHQVEQGTENNAHLITLRMLLHQSRDVIRQLLDQQNLTGELKKSTDAVWNISRQLAEDNKQRVELVRRFSYTGQLKQAAEANLGDFSLLDVYEEKHAPDPNIIMYQGRPVIGRKSKIDGGVYVVAGWDGKNIGEAAVVDGESDEDLAKVYKILSADFPPGSTNRESPETVCNMVFAAAYNHIPYDMERTEALSDKLLDSGNEKIYLSAYFKGGVCRHQALLAGWLLEKLIDQGIIKGTVAVERNFVPGRGGHAWARYTSESGQAYIIDAAQNFVGTLEQATKEVNENKIWRWDYRHPGDV